MEEKQREHTLFNPVGYFVVEKLNHPWSKEV